MWKVPKGQMGSRPIGDQVLREVSLAPNATDRFCAICAAQCEPAHIPGPPLKVWRGRGSASVYRMNTRSGFVTTTGGTAFDIDRELELLELCASELLVIAESGSADRRTRSENQALAAEYRLIAEALRSRLTALGAVPS
jgi:hypothetical protein